MATPAFRKTWSTPPAFSTANATIASFAARSVTSTREEVPADLLGQRAAGLLVHVGDHDHGAGLGQRERGRGADSAGAAREQRDLVSKVIHGPET